MGNLFKLLDHCGDSMEWQSQCQLQSDGESERILSKREKASIHSILFSGCTHIMLATIANHYIWMASHRPKKYP